MLSHLFDRTPIPILSETAAFAQARHSVLASNLVNVHTPGYRTRDLSVDDFQSKLRTYAESLSPRPKPAPTVASPPAPMETFGHEHPMATAIAEAQAAAKNATSSSTIASEGRPSTNVEPSPADQALAAARASARNVLYHDRTDIDLEKQVAEITKNQYMHNMAVALMTNQFQLMASAISERA